MDHRQLTKPAAVSCRSLHLPEKAVTSLSEKYTRRCVNEEDQHLTLIEAEYANL